MVKRLSKFKIYNLNFNYLLAAFVSTLNIGIRRRLRFIKVVKTKLAIRLLRILYQEGIIRTFVIQNDKDLIPVYFKYHESCQICASTTIVSKPSKRVYLGIMRLQKSITTNHLLDLI
jgi:ribosomal protein S8